MPIHLAFLITVIGILCEFIVKRGRSLEHEDSPIVTYQKCRGSAVCYTDYQPQQNFNTFATQNTIQSATRDIIDNQNCNTRQIMDFLVESKIEKLQAENQAMLFYASTTSLFVPPPGNMGNSCFF